MNRKILALGLTLLVMAGVASTSASAGGGDPFSGAWTLNVQKSDFGTGTAPASAKVVISASKKSDKLVNDTTYADGRKVHYEYSGPIDGSDVAVTGAPLFDSVSTLRADKYTRIRTERQGGKVVGIATATVSHDGKTLTAVRRGISTHGPQPSYTSVFDRAKH